MEQGVGTSTLRDYLNVLWRRKWIALQAVLIVPLAAGLLANREPALYNASAGVLLSPQNLADVSGGSDRTPQNPVRIATTQAELARVPEVAQKAVETVGVTGWSASDLLGISSVRTSPDSDILTFSVTYRDAVLATQLANEYAKQFTIYRLDLDRAALKAAHTAAAEQIAVLEAAGKRNSPLHASLLEQLQRLETMEALLTPSAVLVRPATGAGQVQPHVKRSVLLGLVLGLALGLGLALLWEALDSRVRSAEAILLKLPLTLLGRIPKPPRPLGKQRRLVMLDDPNGPHAEAFRILRTNFEFANLRGGARTVMVTSGVEKEGKSTTVANLALALARAGRRITLLDLDLRSASLHRFFGLDAQPGLTDVALGDVAVDDAIVHVDLSDAMAPNGGTGGQVLSEGSLEFLPSGSPPPNPGEFIARLSLTPILERLLERSDIVLIDGPPLLRVGDAVAMSSQVDALIVVARLNIVRERMLDDLSRVLRNCPARKLGVIVAGADLESGYGYLNYPYESPKAVA